MPGLLKGQEVFKLRKQIERAGKKFKSTTSRSKKDFSHNRHDLFEHLRELRKSLALENNIPPYVVFGDKSLHDMCQLMPRKPDRVFTGQWCRRE